MPHTLPLAAPSLQRRLHLGDAADNAAADLRDNLSALAAGDGCGWRAMRAVASIACRPMPAAATATPAG